MVYLRVFWRGRGVCEATDICVVVGDRDSDSESLRDPVHGTLQCVAVCCSVLQCVAVRYSVLQCLAVYYTPGVSLYLSLSRSMLVCCIDLACCSVFACCSVSLSFSRSRPVSHSKRVAMDSCIALG